jgi:predicted ArsR family transcriptional regulator
MDETRVLTTLEEIKAVSDPFRYRIIECLYKMNEAATVKQIADKLGEVPAKIHYHVKKLEKFDLLRLEYTREINGIIAKYYKPTARNFEIKCSEEVQESTKRLMVGETQRMISDIYDKSKNTFLEQVAQNAGNGSKRKGTISTNSLWLTEEEAEKLTKYISQTFEKHTEDASSEGREKYHCFFTVIKMK